MLLDKEAVRAAADVAVVAEEIGLDIEVSGERKMILCPCHNDRHFGSCYLTDRGFKCYACGHKGDIFDLVQHTKNVSFRDAVRIVANICGGEELFAIDSTEASSSSLDSSFISKSEQHLIGIQDGPVWTAVGFVDSKDDLDDDTAHLEASYDKDGNFLGYQVLERRLQSPLYDLFLNDRKSYRELIDTFCEQAVEQYQLQRSLFQQNQISDLQLSLIVNTVKSMQLSSDIDAFLSKKIYQIQKISLIHGNGTVVSTSSLGNQKKAAPLNSALISSIQNSIWKKEGAPF